MSTDQQQRFALNTREHFRLHIELPVIMEIAEESREQVRLNEGIGGQMITNDLSMGGVALYSEVYLPKNTKLAITIEDFPIPLGGARSNDEPFTASVIVRRVAMVDRKPRYVISGQFQASP